MTLAVSSAAPEAPWQDVVVPLADRLSTGPALDVRSDDPWSEAGRKILGHHFARVLIRVPGVVAGDDPEEVHAMRVAARRMRAAWRVFGDAYDRGTTRVYLDELRALGGRLGVVRDLDVRIGILVAYGEHHSKRDRAGLRPLLAAWQADRQARHGELVDTLTAGWFAEVATGLAAFVETPGAAARPVVPMTPSSVRDRAPVVIWDNYLAVSAFGGGLGHAEVATLHELRIAAKWLRYTLEFMREPMGPGAGELIRRVVVLQDYLGDIHDLHAAAVSADAYATGAVALTSPTTAAVGRFVGYEDARVDRLRRRIEPAWRGVAAPDYRRALGRGVAKL
jgi:CHAD domain-containing protein